MTLINQWLTEHGYVILCEGNTGRKSPILLGPPSDRERRGSRSTCSSRRASGASSISGNLSPTSPPDRGSELFNPSHINPPSDDDHNGESSLVLSLHDKFVFYAPKILVNPLNLIYIPKGIFLSWDGFEPPT